jgi:hypothetical protein
VETRTLNQAAKRNADRVPPDFAFRLTRDEAMERYGLVRVSWGRTIGKRRVKIPQAVFGEIALRIAI